MLALRAESGSAVLRDVPRPAAEGESLVRVSLSGICNTDLEIIRGYAGFTGTLGHEFIGVVEESPEAPELVGRRVAGEINAGCGRCERCLSGDPRHCPERTVLGIIGRDGAHAEFLRLPSRNLVTVPDAVADELAVFIEPLAAAIGISEQIEFTPETRVAVIGDGKLGILCARAMRTLTPHTSLIGKHSSKLELAERTGILPILAGETLGLKDAFDVVIEASGSESGFAAAVDLVRPRGKIVLKSTFAGKPTWEAWRIVVEEITIVGSRCGRFQPAVDALAAGRIEVADLISEEFRLAEAVKAVAAAGQKGTLKVLLRP
ncbi:MAG: alcohol dehydrogenase catalytic domain-containing protein [Acidobacteria bacterium]|nr:alcohol dehydrogenase catalytic domain-containing protein [Acidobacteriota bacterium]